MRSKPSRQIFSKKSSGLSLARRVEGGQKVFFQLEFEVAARSDVEGVGQGVGEVGEQLGHLLARFEIELFALFFHGPVDVADDVGGLQADQDLAGVGVLLGQVVDVVAGRQRDVQVAGQRHQLRQDLHLFGHAVVLEFDVKIVLEHLAVPAGRLPGLVLAAVQQLVGDLALDAGRHDQQALPVLFQQFLVDARLAVEALQKGGGDQFAQVAVALVVLDQHQQVEVVELVLAAVGLVEAGIGRQVELGADDRLDLALQGFFIEIDRAQDGAVVGQGHGGHLEIAGFFQQVVDLQGGIEQAVLGMQVQVDEALHSHSMVAGGLEVMS